MKKLMFFIWLFIGIARFMSGEVDMLNYGLCWGVLMLELMDDVISGR